MDRFSDRESWDQTEDRHESNSRRSYTSPTLYVYGKLDDLTEYGGGNNSDNILGSSGTP